MDCRTKESTRKCGERLRIAGRLETAANSGPRVGSGCAQLYLTEATGDERRRLLGFERVELRPGQSCVVTLTAEVRLLARFDGDAGQWHVAGGTYRVALGRSAADLVHAGEVQLAERRFGR